MAQNTEGVTRQLRLIVMLSWLGTFVALGGAHAQAPVAPATAAKGAIEPAAPVVPAEVVAAIQGGDYETARRALVGLREKSKDRDQGSYFAYLQGIAERLAEKRDTARETLSRAIAADPAGPWAPKMRFELAGLELAAGHWAAAEELTRGEAVRLLAGPRKDQLAGVYRAFAQKLLEPSDPLVKPAPDVAYALFVQARELAESPGLRAALLFAMGRTIAQVGNDGRANEHFQQYIKEYPDGADRLAVRFQLGEAQRRSEQLVPARITWTDLARDIERAKPGELPPDAAAIRADALYEIASTFGIPNPPDDASLSQGIAALRRFVAALPAHPRAVRAAFAVGESYRARGKSSEALEAFTQFLKEDGFKLETESARRDWAELAMPASFQVGAILQGQQRFAEAIAAWKGYLAQFPNGPQSADAQRAILDTQLMIAADHDSRGRPLEARAALSDFVSQYPLDARVPQVLFQVGQSFASEQKYDQAIAAWEPLISRFPGSEPAARAQFQTASFYENERGNPAEAIERFRKIAVAPWVRAARERIAVMEAKSLVVTTPRTFRTGEDAHLKIATRNIETLSFTAYKLSAEAYFRKKFALERIESLDIGLVAPDASWTAQVPGYARFKPVESEYDLKKLELPGVYVVKVTDEKTLQATTLVIGSDLDAIVKSSHEQVLVFAQDMKTGHGRPGVRVLVADGGQVVLEGVTGRDGVLLADWKPARAPGGRLGYLILDGPHVAGTGLGLAGQVTQGLSPRAYIYTDRPAYRPGQSVSIKGVVREVAGGQYASVPGSVYRFEVADSRGRLIAARPVTLSEFGTFHQALTLESSAPVGTYRVRVFQPGKSDFTGNFRVDSYKLEPIDLSFELKQTVYFRGETIQADLIARYQYGAPVAARPIEVNLPDGRVVHGTTDAAGKFHVEFLTDGFAEEQALALSARLPEDNVTATAAVVLALKGFEIVLSTSRDVYKAGESFELQIATTDARGEPAGESLSAALIKQVTTRGRVTEREVTRKPVATDPKTGRGSLGFKVDDAQGGRYLLRVAGTDRFGNAIVADRVLTISGTKDDIKLRLLADRQRFKVGEEATVNLHSRDRAGTALVTWEADRILSYRMITLNEGDNTLTWAIDGPQFPNCTLTATRMWRTDRDLARLDIQVERDLRVTVAPAKPSVGPGEPVELDVTTVDQLGRPVSAELSIAMVDQSLLRLHRDTLPDIGPFFYNQTRTGAFATETTNSFRYAPATVAVPHSVVDDAEKMAAMAADEAEAKRAGEHAQHLMPDVFDHAPARENGDAQAPAPVNAGFSLGFNFSMPTDPRFGEKLDAQGIPLIVGTQGGGLTNSDPNLPAQAAVPGDIKFAKVYKDLKLARQKGEPRQRLTETAYWNPLVVTGKDGKGRVAFKAPTALSTYRITARGVTGGDTLAGQTTATLNVRKNFFVDLKLPGALTQGDKPRFIARIHHQGVVGKLALRLTIYAGGRDEVFPRAVELTRDGVDEVLFEPFEVPETDSVRLTVTGSVGDVADELVAEVPVRPWGVRVVAAESGTATNSSTIFVGLPAGRTYDQPEMVITVAPTLKRMLIELALAGPGRPRSLASSPQTTADRAADLLAATAALGYLRETRETAAPDAERLIERIQALAAGLVAAQNDDGGWPWVSAPTRPRGADGEPGPPSDRTTSAAVAWALAAAQPLGLVTDLRVLDNAVGYLKSSLAATSGNDHETRAALLHALSTRNAASFEAANSFYRIRDSLSDPALAYLALTFANLDRASLASEVIAILAARAKTEPTEPGHPSRFYWTNHGRSQAICTATETTALVTLALARIRPGAPELDGAVAWLTAHRAGMGWLPHKAKGPALAALASYFGRAQRAQDRYKLTVTVNQAQVAEINVAGAAESQTIAVPAKALKVGQPNRVSFQMEGRGDYGYAVTLAGFTRDFRPEQDGKSRVASINRRVYVPAAPELDGKVLPVGFDVAVNATEFENLATQVALGGRARVVLSAERNIRDSTPEWERDFLIVEEHVPAGATVIEGTVQSSATSFELADHVLTFYFAPNQDPGSITYDVHGYLPGQYRALAASIKTAYEPGRAHFGPVSDLRVRAAGEPSTDLYKPTPDELYALGKAHFDARRYTDAGAALEPLFAGYTLTDDVGKNAARMLLLINISAEEPRKIVQYFEVVKEKAPELVLTFDQLLAIGKAYRDINEYERAMIVWRGLIEASYLVDARVGELLRQRGKTLESIAYLIALARSYPNTASIETDFFGLSQVVAQTAAQAFTNPGLRRELAAAGITPTELFLQSIRMIQVFLCQTPKNPVADEASLALLGAFAELEDFKTVDTLAARFATLYPKSPFQDSFQYSQALADFHLGQYDRAIDVAQKIALATYKDAAGALEPSPNKWQALYILGQIHDARKNPGKALEYYRQVADRFSDAASAIQSYTRKQLRVPEVSVIRTENRPIVAAEPAPVGFRMIDVAPGGAAGASRPEPAARPGIGLDYRNIGQVDVKVYPVDLMQLYLTRRNLNGIATIDLAGVTPLVEKTVALGDGALYDDRSKSIDLPITNEGAYLTMIRGDNLYASGIVLVTPMEMEVLEEVGPAVVGPGAATIPIRVRITVRDARTKDYLAKVQVKVIGSDTPQFISGETDLRGVFVAEGVRGVVTAIARKGAAQYAFYRGTTYLGAQPVNGSGLGGGQATFSKPAAQEQGLDANLKMQNTANSNKQIERLHQRFAQPADKSKGAAAGGFR